MAGAAKAAFSPEGSSRATMNQHPLHRSHGFFQIHQSSLWSRLPLNYAQAVFGRGQLDTGSLYVQMAEGQLLHQYFASAYLISTHAANFTGYYMVQ